jgi:CheY-like chemotaxis protein
MEKDLRGHPASEVLVAPESDRERLRGWLEDTTAEALQSFVCWGPDESRIPLLLRLRRIGNPTRYHLLEEVRSGSRGVEPDDGERAARRERLIAVGSLARGIAHDFNNSLTAIFGYMDLARGQLAPQHPATASLDKAVQAARSASTVTRSLLAYTRQSEGAFGEVDLGRMLEEAHAVLRRLLPSSLVLDMELPAEGEVLVYGDEVRLQQMLLILTGGAREEVGRQGRLSFSLRRHEAGADRQRPVELAVRYGPEPGEGGGVLRGEPRILLPPHLGDTEGLSLLHRIVVAHRGRLYMDKTPEGGRRFRILLPELGRGPHEELRPRRPGHGLVVVAEDDGFVRSILLSQLRAAGYEVVEAADGMEVLRVWEQHRHRRPVVVLDLDLPLRSGLDCARVIRRQDPSATIILMTGDPGLAETETPADPVSLLQKPFPVADLLRLVETHASPIPSPEDEA